MRQTTCAYLEEPPPQSRNAKKVAHFHLVSRCDTKPWQTDIPSFTKQLSVPFFNAPPASTLCFQALLTCDSDDMVPVHLVFNSSCLSPFSKCDTFGKCTSYIPNYLIHKMKPSCSYSIAISTEGSYWDELRGDAFHIDKNDHDDVAPLRTNTSDGRNTLTPVFGSSPKD